MTTLFNLGSINQDLFYHMDRLARPGETLAAHNVTEALGGKGMNQSIAAVKSRAKVVHIGAMGTNTPHLETEITRLGVGHDHIAKLAEIPTGSAVIALDKAGENFILLNGGANRSIPADVIKAALATATDADWLVLQNETNGVDAAVQTARAHGMRIILSAAPFDADQVGKLLPLVDLIAVNEYEAAQIEAHLDTPLRDLSGTDFLITYGAKGAEFLSGGKSTKIDAFRVTPVDTTGAGDTFLGAFAALWTAGNPIENSLRYAAAASAIQVTRQGAAIAIPNYDDISAFLKENS